MNNDQEECCPLLEESKWESVTHEWVQKPFVMESIPTLFHMPFPPMIGWKIHGMDEKIDAAGQAEAIRADTLVLFRDPSAFKSEIYISVKGPVARAHNTTLSGTFVSKVYAGSYNSVPVHIKAMDAWLAESGKKAQDYFIHYAYCPKCAKKYGANKMVLFARV